MTDDGRKAFFTTLPGILSGVAALTVAITSISFGVYDRRNRTPPRPDPVTPVGQPAAVGPAVMGPAVEGKPAVSLEARRQQAERLAGEYLDALVQHDVVQLQRLSETPFYSKREILVTRGSLTALYVKLFDKDQDEPEGLRIKKIRALTLAEIKETGLLPHRDSVFIGFSLADTDWLIELHLRVPERDDEQVFMFARAFGDQLKIVGMWN